MGRVVYYNELHDFTADDIVVIDNGTEENLEYLEQYVQEYQIRPKKIYKLINIQENQKILLLYYIKSIEKMGIVDINIDSKHLALFKAFPLVIDSVHEFDLFKYKRMKNKLFELFNGELKTFNRIQLLFDMYENFLENLATPMCQETPILYQNLQDIRTKHWLEFDFKQSEKLHPIISALASYKQTPFFDAEQISFIDLKIQEYKNLLDDYNNTTTHIDKKIFILSAYFLAQAEHYNHDKEYNVALIYIHRAMDLYLQYKAKKLSLIKYENNKLLYTANNSDHIYLHETMKKLIAYDRNMITTLQENFLLDLNDYRRYLMLSHSIFAIQDIKVEEYIGAAKDLVKDIDGDTQWEQKVNTCLFKDIFSESNLFIFEGSMDTYCQEIKL